VINVEEILRVENLRINFITEDGVVKAIDGVSFSLKRGEVLGIVGETGCGKSVTAHAILRLLPQPPAQIVGGRVVFEGKNLLDLSEDEMNKIRGNGIAMIFQEPMTSLNPAFTIKEQMVDVITLHRNVSKKEAVEIAASALRDVKLPQPEIILNKYPHELSGGQRQRVMIAMALSCQPKILIADEPTTALDVTIQAQILNLIKNLQEKYKMSVMIITHDMGVVAQISDRVAVMYAGNVVEIGDVKEVLKSPIHPYTKGLLKSIPKIENPNERLETIPGSVPNLIDPPSGCRFHPRCSIRNDICEKKKPLLEEVKKGRYVACHMIRRDSP